MEKDVRDLVKDGEPEPVERFVSTSNSDHRRAIDPSGDSTYPCGRDLRHKYQHHSCVEEQCLRVLKRRADIGQRKSRQGRCCLPELDWVVVWRALSGCDGLQFRQAQPKG